MKILNLYAGLGGNRKLWKGHSVTAIEWNPEIASFYAKQFPDDIVIVEDAHQFLLEHVNEYDFIWSSIECPSHSRARYWASKGGRYKPVYPDMKLYEEIIFLQHFCKGKWVVENTKPYYKPLITPTVIIERHCLWSNFSIPRIKVSKNKVFDGTSSVWQEETGFDLSEFNFGVRKDKLFRNCVNPVIGLHVLNCALSSNKLNRLFK
ncbi:MAG: DNA cytosine methyltransferase [Bacteroidales bacterium]|nr:DNA cytosine methyltransferase [Bacteroidales bacterium]